MLGLPFMFIKMMESQRLCPRDVGSLRHCAAGGDVCPIQVQRDFQRQFGVPLHSLWGATEAPASLTHGLLPGPVCRIIQGAQISLVDNQDVPVPRGEIGELLVRGPTVMAGYWEGPGHVVRPTTDAWYHTGDLMRQGDGNDIWFVSRKKDIIIRGGSNISPMEIEQVLLTHPAVRAAAAFGTPDRTLGQRVVAFVQLIGNPRESVLDDILASARTQLADYKVPDRLTIVSEIPRKGLGKVDRDALLAIASGSPTESSAGR